MAEVVEAAAVVVAAAVAAAAAVVVAAVASSASSSSAEKGWAADSARFDPVAVQAALTEGESAEAVSAQVLVLGSLKLDFKHHFSTIPYKI